jgi:hypothetical protein
MALLTDIRKHSGNPELPCIFNRYEKFSQRLPEIEPYRAYADVIDSKICLLAQIDKHILLAPIDYMEQKYFCEDHHYTNDGYKVFARDVAKVVQDKKLDFWTKGVK